MNPTINKAHHFLDEAGDTTFFGKGNIPVLGIDGVSKYFILGKIVFNTPLQILRNEIIVLEQEVLNNPYFQVASVHKKRNNTGRFYFHATDDLPELRMLFYNFIQQVDCDFEAIVANKSIERFVKKHNGSEKEFYADLLSHLLEKTLELKATNIFIISRRGNTTRVANLENGLNKAVERFKQSKPDMKMQGNIIFDIQSPITEPLLTIADYLCWAIQRKFEKGEGRFFDYIKNKVTVVTEI